MINNTEQVMGVTAQMMHTNRRVCNTLVLRRGLSGLRDGGLRETGDSQTSGHESVPYNVY